uniref:Uncharacterized protein n=1 Tax=Sphaerodactylus townsendi TaxID=933632 RepID=A0ACB8FXY9_9SAUR
MAAHLISSSRLSRCSLSCVLQKGEESVPDLGWGGRLGARLLAKARPPVDISIDEGSVATRAPRKSQSGGIWPGQQVLVFHPHGSRDCCNQRSSPRLAGSRGLGSPGGPYYGPNAGQTGGRSLFALLQGASTPIPFPCPNFIRQLPRHKAKEELDWFALLSSGFKTDMQCKSAQVSTSLPKRPLPGALSGSTR